MIKRRYIRQGKRVTSIFLAIIFVFSFMAGSPTMALAADAGEGAQTVDISPLQGEEDTSPAVEIPDINLKKALLDALKVSYGNDEEAAAAKITENMMATLTALDASSRNIKELTGLYKAVNLQSLNLSGNPLDDANRNTWDFSAFVNEFAAFVKLEYLNLSNCRLGDIDTGNGSGVVPDSNSNLYQLADNLPSLKTLDLSDNNLYGGFYFMKTVVHNNLKTIDLSRNRLTSVNDFDQRFLPNLEKLDLSDNYLYWDELSGSWIENLINAGSIVDHSNQKNLAELYRLIVLKPGAAMSSYKNNSQAVAPGADGVFACQAIVGDSVTFAAFSFTDAFIKITVDGNEKFTATPIAKASEISQQTNYYVVSGLAPGAHEISLDVMHLNGDTKQYKLRIATAAIPNEGENSAGILDINLQYALCAKLGIENPASHVITKDELATLKGSLTLNDISNPQGIQYLTGITSLIVKGDFTQVPALPDNLTMLSLSGKFEQLPALPEGLTSLTLNGNFSALPALPASLTTLNLTGEHYNELPALPESVTSLTLNGTFSAVPDVGSLAELKILVVDAPNLSAPIDVSKNTKITRYVMSAAKDGSLSSLKGLTELKNLTIYYARNSLQPEGLDDCEKLTSLTLSLLYPGTYSIPRGGDKAFNITYSIKYASELLTDVEDFVTFDISSTNGAANKWTLHAGKNVLLKGSSDTIERISGSTNFAADFGAPNLAGLVVGNKKNRDVEGFNNALYRMPNLTSLSMSSTEMTELPKGVESLSKLETLDISSSQIQTIAADFGKCAGLKEIKASYAALRIAPNAEELPASLEVLNFYGTKIEYLRGSFAHLTNLKELNITQSPLVEFPAGVKDAVALEELNASTGFYGDIPADTFDKLVNLKTVRLGDWIPVVLENGKRVAAPGTSAALAVEKLKQVAPNASVGFTIAGDNPFFNTGTSNYSGLLDLQSDTGTIDGRPYETRSLALVVPIGTQSITLTPKAVLKDTKITIGDQTVGDGVPIKVDGLHEGANTITIQNENSFTNFLMRDTVTTYTLNVIVGEYASSLEEGYYYQTKLNMYKTGTTTDSMSGKYIEPVAIVRLKDGRYEVRFTVTSSSSIPYVGYYYTGDEQPTEAEKLSATADDKATYRVYTKTLEEPIVLRLFPAPMGYFVTADMVIDRNGMVDITSSMPSVDKTELAAAINRAETELKKSIYTTASYNALKAAADEAKEVNATATATQEEVDAAASELKSALDGLQIDQSKLANKASLESALDEAKALEKGNHTDTAWNALQNAIADAQAVHDELTATQKEVDSATKTLKTAITLFNSSGEASELDKDNLKDGVYTLNADMIKINRQDYSMSNDAIGHKVTLTVEDGDYCITMEFKGLRISDQFGYLSRLQYYGEGFGYDNYGNPQGTLLPATVLSHQQDDNGNVIVDQYNDSANPYPKQLQFTLVNKADYEDNYVPLQVFVPIMEAISAGSGTQDVLMRLDWTTLKEQEEPSVDKSALLTKIDEAKACRAQKDKYTDDSYAASGLEAAIIAAEAVLNNDAATKEQVSEQVNALNDAMNKLVLWTEDKTDKTVLTAKMAEAKAIAKGDYTDASWEALQTAITSAQAVADKTDATQQDVDDAAAALTEAINSLKKRPAAPGADTLSDEATGVKLEAEAGVLPEGTTMKVIAVTTGADYEKAKPALKGIGGKFQLYDITLLGPNGSAIQPNGKVKVSIPLPEGMKEDLIAVYSINEDGSKTLIESSVENGYVVFYTDHFSLYAIVEKSAAGDRPDNGDKPDKKTVKESGGSAVPETGTNEPSLLWQMLPFAAAAVIALLMASRRRKERGKLV